jgi:neutral ceramidase
MAIRFSLIILLLCRLASAEETKDVFRAGAATANITPPLGSLVVGGFRPYPAEHIHDELHVRCLVLDDGQTQIAFAICDNVGIAREVFDAARTMITAETGLAADHVLMSATHTHSGPSARGWKRLVPSELTDYQQFVARRIADAVRCALNNREPARIAWGSVAEPSQIFNRRFYCTDPEVLKNPFGGVDQVCMNPPRQHPSIVRPAGPTDPEISFLSVQSTDGRPISLLANYSLHYVGGVRGADISADYFAIFADRIAELLGAAKQDPPFVGIMTNGTSGDVISTNFQAEAQKFEPYEKMRRIADIVAQRVHEAHAALEFHDRVTLSATLRELPLAVRNPSPEQLEWARTTLAKPEDAPKYYVLEREYAQRILDLETAPTEISVPLQAVRIGDVGIVAIPFEVFAETGLSIKEHSPLQPTFTISLANGSYGYLPTPPQHALGGYETWLGTNFVETEASEKIERTLLEMLGGLSK